MSIDTQARVILLMVWAVIVYALVLVLHAFVTWSAPAPWIGEWSVLDRIAWLVLYAIGAWEIMWVDK